MGRHKKSAFLVTQKDIKKELHGIYKDINSWTAIKDELERIEKEKIKRAIVEASKDPLFLSDIKEIERDFEYADYEEMGKRY